MVFRGSDWSHHSMTPLDHFGILESKKKETDSCEIPSMDSNSSSRLVVLDNSSNTIILEDHLPSLYLKRSSGP